MGIRSDGSAAQYNPLIRELDQLRISQSPPLQSRRPVQTNVTSRKHSRGVPNPWLMAGNPNLIRGNYTVTWGGEIIKSRTTDLIYSPNRKNGEVVYSKQANRSVDMIYLRRRRRRMTWASHERASNLGEAPQEERH